MSITDERAGHAMTDAERLEREANAWEAIADRLLRMQEVREARERLQDERDGYDWAEPPSVAVEEIMALLKSDPWRTYGGALIEEEP